MYYDVLQYEPSCILFCLSGECNQVKESCRFLNCLKELPNAHWDTV